MAVNVLDLSEGNLYYVSLLPTKKRHLLLLRKKVFGYGKYLSHHV